MRLNKLYESHAVAKGPCEFYCDPLAKKAGVAKTVEGDSDDDSFIKGGTKERNRFAGKMNKPSRRKKK